MTPAVTTKAVFAIRGLNERPFVGGGCCALPATDVLRAELERWPDIAKADVDSSTGEVTLTMVSSTDLKPIYEMLEDLGYPACRVR